jgi:transketolase
MLLYSLLHLSGMGLSLDDLKNFRQLHSKTPGHPENFVTQGVETTTGPLGQGFANAVGMALAERHLVSRFPDLATCLQHKTFVIAGDGCLQEGVSSEAASLAGHLGLGNLVVLWDDNSITIDGPTSISFTEDVTERFVTYGWHVDQVDGHDMDAIAKAVHRALQTDNVPSLIACKTTIGKGSPNKAGKSSSHGSPLGDDEIKLTKEGMGWPQDAFLVPTAVEQRWAKRREEWKKTRAAWNAKWEELRASHPEQVTQVEQWFSQDTPDLSEVEWPVFEVGSKAATRATSGKVLQALAKAVPNLLGGSADLTGSNKTYMNERGEIARYDYAGQNIRYGVREHAMGSMMNGMALHGGVVPFGGTFLVFTDYCRPAIRLSALMGTHVVWVMTHDSIFLGEDGPTHQPVEHVMALRTIPNLRVIRPADGTETAYAWRMALAHKGPSVLSLSRQGLPELERDASGPSAGENVLRGGYSVWEAGGEPQLILIATGSEVALAIEAAQTLHSEDGRAVRVVSMPCWEVFMEQDQDYRDDVLPARCGARVSIEAGVTFGWERFTGDLGLQLGIDRFGASAPADVLAEEYGLTCAAVVARVRSYMSES